MRHTPPASAAAGAPLTLALQISGATKPKQVRLHYRAANQLVPFKVLEVAPGAAFTIPGHDIQGQWDLMYYFEVIDDSGGGWFQPEPTRETPYYVVKVTK